jgi:hypothetical protein
VARDPKLWKRNALAIPGGLLVVYAVAGLVYVLAYRTPTPACAVAHRFLVQSHCYSAYPFLAAILLLGLALMAVGLIVFRGRVRDLPGHLHSGTPTHFTIAFLASLVVVPASVWLVLYYVENSQGLSAFVTTVGENHYETKALFLLVAMAALFALAPFLGLYLAQGRLRRTFLRRVEEVAAQEADPFPGEEAKTPDDGLTVPPEEFMDESAWPDARPEEKPAAPPLGVPAPAAPEARDVPPLATDVRPQPAPPVTWPPAAATHVPPYLTPPPAKQPTQAAAPVVAVASGCRAVLPNGAECGKIVGPGGRYCVSHACQAKTASGSACRNPAMEGATRCPAHSQ